MAIPIRDVMTRQVEAFHPEMTLTELDCVLVNRAVSGGPVVEEERLVGVVSRADVIRALYEQQVEAQQVSGFYSSPFPIAIPELEHLARGSRKIADRMTMLRVREIMSPDPLVVGPDDDVEFVARLLSGRGFHRVLVTEGERVCGIVSALDLVRLLGERGLASA